MDKLQAYNNYWSGFGIPAFEANSVPDKQPKPYITYESSFDDFGNQLSLTASLWYRTSTWSEVVVKATQIEQAIGRGGQMIRYDGGAFWIHRGTPFAIRTGDSADDMIKRIVLNVEVEFISEV